MSKKEIVKEKNYKYEFPVHETYSTLQLNHIRNPPHDFIYGFSRESLDQKNPLIYFNTCVSS